MWKLYNTFKYPPRFCRGCGCTSPLSICLKEQVNSIPFSRKVVVSLLFHPPTLLHYKWIYIPTRQIYSYIIHISLGNFLQSSSSVEASGFLRNVQSASPEASWTWDSYNMGGKNKEKKIQTSIIESCVTKQRRPGTALEFSYYGHVMKEDETKGVMPLQQCC